MARDPREREADRQRLLGRIWDEEEALKEAREPRCKLCGSTEVRWRQQGGRWVLFSLKPGVEHTCEIDPENDPRMGDFE